MNVFLSPLLKLQFLKQINRLDQKWRIQVFTGSPFPGNQQDFHRGYEIGSWQKQGENNFIYFFKSKVNEY